MKKCICGKEMKETTSNVETQECYPGGNYGTSCESQKGHKCPCGLFIGRTGCVYKNKTYPYWKYSSDDIKEIMDLKR